MRRLKFENALDLVSRIAKCGTPLTLECCSCGTTKMAEQKCKRKWCPVCAWRLAASRADELRELVSEFRWPLFVTLTMRNTDDLSEDAVRHLRRAFGKLRGRKMWAKRVAGGVAAIEVTNIGNGWHPHLHAVIDCAWFAWKTPPPQRGMSREAKRQRFAEAKRELERTWAKCLGHEMAVVHVKRCSASTIAKEVVKYSVKPGTLVDSPDPIAPIIRCLDKTRLLTTFGTAHGRVSSARARARNAAATRSASRPVPDGAEPGCCGKPHLFPQDVIRMEWRKVAERSRPRCWKPAEGTGL